MPQRKKFTQSVPLPKGTEFSVEVESDANYNPGRPNVSQGVIESDITIQATPATPITLMISCIKYEHQSIEVSVYNATETEVIDVYTDQAIIVLPFGTKYSVKLKAHEGYVKSKLINIVEGRIYSLSFRNITISAEAEATPILCELTVEPTEHQTIHVTTDQGISIDSDVDDGITVVVSYWSKYTASIEADPGYFPGILNIPGGEQTVSGDVTVKASHATENKHRLTIYKYDHQKLYVSVTFNDETEVYSWDTEGAIETTSSYKVFEIFDSSTMTISIEPDEGYQSLYPQKSYIDDEGVTHVEDVTDSEQIYVMDRNYDILAKAPASVKYFTITLNQSRDEMMYLTSGEYEDITGSVILKYNSTYEVRAESLIPSLFKPGEVIATGEGITKVAENKYIGTVTGDNTLYITAVTLL